MTSGSIISACCSFVTVVVLALLVFTIVLETNFKTVWRDTYVYSGTLCDEGEVPAPIPMVLRQTWKTSRVPDTHLPWVDSWHRGLEPRWRVLLETDADISSFIHAEFPYFMPVWDKLHPFIKKVDCVRYMWMLRYGGVYSDLDTKLMRPSKFESVFENTTLKPPVAFIPATHTSMTRDKDRASPAFLGSHPRHPIWIDALEYVARNGWRSSVKEATGPIALTNILLRWQQQGRQESVVLVSETMLGIGRFKSFPGVYPAVHHHNSSLWDNSGENMPWSMPRSVFDGLAAEREKLSLFAR